MPLRGEEAHPFVGINHCLREMLASHHIIPGNASSMFIIGNHGGLEDAMERLTATNDALAAQAATESDGISTIVSGKVDAGNAPF
jgi:hypothetical protein